jgi:hypothetical protein
MMLNAKKALLIGSALLGSFFVSTIQAETTSMSETSPHFSVFVENKTDQQVTMRFRENQGSSYLEPALADNTPLAAHKKSLPYGVVFPQLGRKDTFDIIVTGKQDCAFTIGFYAPGNPNVVIQGPGCFGGGYSVNLAERYVLLYVTDIHKK